ncbi:hypothetical protein BTVI_96084 [Pitangus sulphuratus]|nr:hypothetical protein BTVI_96084 [Pitangus sulphuratus]
MWTASCCEPLVLLLKEPMGQLDLWKDWRMEDEAVLDRGASFLKHVCDEEEVEGHHTIYIGVHVPKSYRRRRRHRRRPGHKEKKEKEKISENYSDKSDVENADETSSSILKPLKTFLLYPPAVSHKRVQFSPVNTYHVSSTGNPGKKPQLEPWVFNLHPITGID